MKNMYCLPPGPCLSQIEKKKIRQEKRSKCMGKHNDQLVRLSEDISRNSLGRARNIFSLPFPAEKIATTLKPNYLLFKDNNKNKKSSVKTTQRKRSKTKG
eukprot:gnl/MRDRNA2_/MRDRNA2_72663_c0_seq1.p1 gnl/MRDRNA2_/MRDRNA2_72663_c0~~gnl/MRDRNA2_/MRDRNA2_72663_c0_seq1.p1  ORF type:complete len:100 (-),score=4.45 gnl/MRDRNA2_/MRDRNA2_72663_c0_seq1:72-371(-)